MNEKMNKKTIKVYTDDMLVKLEESKDNVTYLQKVFDILGTLLLLLLRHKVKSR